MGRFLVEAATAEAGESLVREWLEQHGEIRSEDGDRIPSIQVSRTLRAGVEPLEEGDGSKEGRRFRIDGRPLLA
jgi:hypothetical protein